MIILHIEGWQSYDYILPRKQNITKWAVLYILSIGVCWLISHFQLPEFDIFQCGLISLNVILKQISSK